MKLSDTKFILIIICRNLLKFAASEILMHFVIVFVIHELAMNICKTFHTEYFIVDIIKCFLQGISKTKYFGECRNIFTKTVVKITT